MVRAKPGRVGLQPGCNVERIECACGGGKVWAVPRVVILVEQYVRIVSPREVQLFHFDLFAKIVMLQ